MEQLVQGFGVGRLGRNHFRRVGRLLGLYDHTRRVGRRPPVVYDKILAFVDVDLVTVLIIGVFKKVRYDILEMLFVLLLGLGHLGTSEQCLHVALESIDLLARYILFEIRFAELLFYADGSEFHASVGIMPVR